MAGPSHILPSGLSHRLSRICLHHVGSDTGILLFTLWLSFRPGVATCESLFATQVDVTLTAMQNDSLRLMSLPSWSPVT
jgi:hypothetical protein